MGVCPLICTKSNDIVPQRANTVPVALIAYFRANCLDDCGGDSKQVVLI